MKKVVFTGCSFTSGHGWNPNWPGDRQVIHAPELWVNLCHQQIPRLQNLELVNLGLSSCNNADVFQSTVKAIAEHDIDIIFCQWTAMPRYRFSVGFELDQTREAIQPLSRSKTGYENNPRIGWSREYLDDLLDRLKSLHHLHGEIIKVVEYSNILKKLTKNLGIKICFVNGMCPWDQDYFVRSSDYTPFTKDKILNVDSRQPEEIAKLYKIMHDDYELAGGIDPSNWVNLYSSMFSTIIDYNYDRLHPGSNSNQLYFQQVKQFLENNG